MDKVAQIEQFLINVISNNKITTYGYVSNLFGFQPFNGDWSEHPLCMIFDQIDRMDALNNRPFKTAVVLNHSSGYVGQGFFKALQRYKYITCVNSDAKLAAWCKEIKGCYAYNW